VPRTEGGLRDTPTAGQDSLAMPARRGAHRTRNERIVQSLAILGVLATLRTMSSTAEGCPSEDTPPTDPTIVESTDRLVPDAISPGNDLGSVTSRSEALLRLAVKLESGTHPDSAHAHLSPRISKAPPWLRVTGIIVATAASTWSGWLFAHASNTVTGLTYYPLFILSLLVLAPLVWVQFPTAMRRINRVVDDHLVWCTAGVAATAVTFLYVVARTAEERLQTAFITVGLIMVVRSFNQGSFGRSYRQRFIRLTIASHSQRVLVGLLIFSASWAVLLSAVHSSVQTPVSPVAAAGAIIGAASAAIGAAIRVMARQRKQATLVLVAIDELLANLSVEWDSKKAIPAWLSLDRCLSTGYDTGVRFFATPAESEHMRALLAACVDKIGHQPVQDPAWKLLAIAKEAVSGWDNETCRDSVCAYLVKSRSYFAKRIDTAA
jgi:hypothetical protein